MSSSAISDIERLRRTSKRLLRDARIHRVVQPRRRPRSAPDRQVELGPIQRHRSREPLSRHLRPVPRTDATTDSWSGPTRHRARIPIP